MVILPSDLTNNKTGLGSKTLNLRKLQELGLNVPNFVAIPSSVVKTLWEDKSNGAIMQQLLNEIKNNLPATKYVVRSSALIEDTSQSSFAGQFLTKIDLHSGQLASAITEVIEDGYQKLNGQLEQFSLIVQEYVEVDYSGITFTRNPLGSREMVVEYLEGIGENVVGGKVKPKNYKLYWTDKIHAIPLPNFSQAIDQFKKIEQYYQFPQDIEWCFKNGSYFYLQTRPITTITSTQYQESLLLDKVLPRDGKFFYEKTEISEIAPRPTAITYDILHEIYKQGSAVDKVYRKYSVTYQEQDFLTIIGNELYVNREEEIKTLLPSYSYLANTELKPKFHTLNGIFRTLKNIVKINSLNATASSLLKEVKGKLEYNIPSDEGFQTAFNRFLNDYCLIFEINLLAEKALKRFHFAVSKNGGDEALLLSLPNKEMLGNIDLKDNLLGNSLEIKDTTTFSSKVSNSTNQTANEVFQRLPSWKQLQLKPLIKNAQDFTRLREYGRWLTVRHISHLRDILLNLATKHNFKTAENVYFYKISEIISNQLSEQVAEERKEQHESFSKFNFPIVLSNVFGFTSENKPVGVSPGIAEGVLVEVNEISKHTEPIILYTKILSPDLVQYFPKIKGILSQRGGILSHLAIMAREHHIPVIVNFNIAESKIKLGEKVVLNATENTVKT